MLDGFDGLPLARLCVNKLSGFLENTDQNRQYLGSFSSVYTDSLTYISKIYCANGDGKNRTYSTGLGSGASGGYTRESQ